MIQVNLFNKHNQRGSWSIVKDFFEVRIRIVVVVVVVAVVVVVIVVVVA